MSRTEFVEKWQERLLWLGQRGLALDTDERCKGPFGAGRYALALPEKIQKLVIEVLNDAQTVEPRPLNGAATHTVKR